jgi:hypothetical protein
MYREKLMNYTFTLKRARNVMHYKREPYFMSMKGVLLMSFYCHVLDDGPMGPEHAKLYI